MIPAGLAKGLTLPNCSARLLKFQRRFKSLFYIIHFAFAVYIIQLFFLFVNVNGHDKIRINGHEKPAQMASI